MSAYYKFQKDFLWGVATASYQVEGAVNEDGRGPSVWDTFSHKPGNIKNDDAADITTDQYHLYKKDVQLMKWLGVKAYRFSISWSRIFPDGRGKVNQKGLDYYNNLINELIANGIEPWVTFFHWDLPQKLEDDFGGWASKETAKYFGEYVAFVTKAISDRVRNFFTVNEFCNFADSGYYGTSFPPGKTLRGKAFNNVSHNAVLAHGLAVQAIRANAVKTPFVGLAENPLICVPVYETASNIEAAKKAMRFFNPKFLSVILDGKYSDDYLNRMGADAPDFNDDELKIIGSPLDFVGINAYSPTYIKDSTTPKGFENPSMQEGYTNYESWLQFAPQIAYWGPRLLKEIWNVKNVFITENGCPCKDKFTHNGEIMDMERVMFLREHLISMHRAVSEGYPLKGYFVWSLLDNFEWTEGFSKRFGLFHVNYKTQERTPKLSAKFYKEVIAANSVL